MNYDQASALLNEVITATPRISYTTSRKSGLCVRQGHSENGHHGHYFIEAAPVGSHQKILFGYQEGRSEQGPWAVSFGPRHKPDQLNRAKFVSAELNTTKHFPTFVAAVLYFVEAYGALATLN